VDYVNRRFREASAMLAGRDSTGAKQVERRDTIKRLSNRKADHRRNHEQIGG
jgi:hypothetical protein